MPAAAQRKAQSSVELIILLGIGFIAMLFFAIVATNLVADSSSQQNYDAARVTVQKLAAAADSVAAQGSGASANITVEIPTNTNFSASFIGRPSGASASRPSTGINLNLDGTDVTAYAKTPVIGAFPPIVGTQAMVVRSYGSYVAIGSNLITVLPDSISLAMQQNQTRLVHLNVTINSPQLAQVNITSSWPYSSPSLSIQSSAFFGFNGTVVPVVLNFTSNSTISGIYNSELTVASLLNSSWASPVETIRVPVSVQVGVG